MVPAQAGEAFPITILFKPRTSILTQCARFLEKSLGGGFVLEGEAVQSVCHFNQ